MSMREKIALAVGDGLGGPGLGEVYRRNGDIRWPQSLAITDAILNILNEYGEEAAAEIGRDIARRVWKEAPAHSYTSLDSGDAHYEWVSRAAIKAFLGTLS